MSQGNGTPPLPRGFQILLAVALVAAGTMTIAGLAALIPSGHGAAAAWAAPAPAATHGNVTFRVVVPRPSGSTNSPSAKPTSPKPTSPGPTTPRPTSHGPLPVTGNSPGFGALFAGGGLLTLLGIVTIAVARRRRSTT